MHCLLASAAQACIRPQENDTQTESAGYPFFFLTVKSKLDTLKLRNFLPAYIKQSLRMCNRLNPNLASTGQKDNNQSLKRAAISTCCTGFGIAENKQICWAN